jgi:hypothetical protein
MTGQEHFQAAIDMLDDVGAEQRRGKTVTIADAIAAAQVHATLALASAVAKVGSDLVRIDRAATDG